MEHAVREKDLGSPAPPSGSAAEPDTRGPGPENDKEQHVDVSLHGDDDTDSDSSDPEDAQPASRTHSVITRVLSRVSTHTLNPGPPPDGGFSAWMAGKHWCPSPASCRVLFRKANIPCQLSVRI